jgi:hypothetical protein
MLRIAFKQHSLFKQRGREIPLGLSHETIEELFKGMNDGVRYETGFLFGAIVDDAGKKDMFFSLSKSNLAKKSAFLLAEAFQLFGKTFLTQ